MHKYLLLPLLFLTACGPVYNTEYTLTPPTSAQGKQCANQCFYTRGGCVDACSSIYTSCDRGGLYGGVGYGSGWRRGAFGGIGYGTSSYDRANCRYDTDMCVERCEIIYRQCFTGCGGSVTPTTTCVRDCPPPLQP